MRFQTLDEWLEWQADLHPSAIELGLGRVSAVWQRMHSKPLPATVITVAGTNGKGSCVAMLDAILRAGGYSSGCYSSPHLLRYNERIRINGAEASDEQICDAFERVDQARADISLTYFEFGTLAALHIFAAARPEILILEVGLGGRLDAVNIIDPDVALITSVGLDHMDWLGETRELIALEKAGILRSGRPAVCGDPDPPHTLHHYAEELGVPLHLLGRDFRYQARDAVWDWQGNRLAFSDLPRPALPGNFQLQNAAAVLATLEVLADKHPLSAEAVAEGLRQVRLAGRFQEIAGPISLILDVAHNPAAAQVLADTLKETPCQGRTLAVFAMLADKDIDAVASIMAPHIDHWYLGAVADRRAASAQELQQRLTRLGLGDRARSYAQLAEAFRAARCDAAAGDRVLVFGSFLTVAGVMELLAREPSPCSAAF